MPTPSEVVRSDLKKLVGKFEADKAHELSKPYSEAQACLDFVTPFSKALGWDVENEAGRLHHQRAVIVESGETEGRPDDNFRLGGTTKFFVEAESPAQPPDAARHDRMMARVERILEPNKRSTGAHQPCSPLPALVPCLHVPRGAAVGDAFHHPFSCQGVPFRADPNSTWGVGILHGMLAVVVFGILLLAPVKPF